MTELGTTGGPEVLVELDPERRTPLHLQLTDGLRQAIRSGRLAPESRLPSTRVLATDLGVSRRLVVDAYGQLVAEGYLHSRQGAGTRVAAIDASAHPRRSIPDPPRRVSIDFDPCSPDLGSFPRQAWLRALRHGLAATESSALGYRRSPDGLLGTRIAVADYLSRTRGVVADADHVVLCSGVTQALTLLARCIRGPVATEDPGFWAYRKLFQYHGIQQIPVSVDAHGLDVAALGGSSATTVMVTPAHQSPTGVVLAPARRNALCEWARDGRLIIEDDYDAEFRYDRVPVGALQGIAPDRVAYLGSVSKTLAPGLRLGWMVLPDHLVEPVRIAKTFADNGSSVMDQIAFAHLLESGAYARYLRQMRKRYLARRNALLGALAEHLPWATVLGAAAGVQLTVRFPADFPLDEVLQRTANTGVHVEALTRSYAEPAAAPPGLIIGYANLTETQIRTGIRSLSEAAHGIWASTLVDSAACLG